MTIFEKARVWVVEHPLYALLLAAALILVLFWFKDTLGAGIERVNQWRFSKTVAAQKVDIDKLTKENERLMGEIKKAFALGEAKELERDAAYAELEKYGAQARAAVEAQKEAAKEYESDKVGITVDIPLFDRCKKYCSDRAELGYGCKPNAVVYCERYAGR